MDLRRDLLPLLKETYSEFQADEASTLGAALAYYALFSLFPLLLLLIAGLGYVLQYWDQAINVQDEILAAVSRNFSPQLSDALNQILGGIKNNAGGATVIGLVTLLIGASSVFQQLDLSFNKIWKVPAPEQSVGLIASVLQTIRTKLFSFGMVLAVGFLLLVSMALTGATQVLLDSFQRCAADRRCCRLSDRPGHNSALEYAGVRAAVQIPAQYDGALGRCLAGRAGDGGAVGDR